MPKSSPLKLKVISALVKSMSPSKKKHIFSDARRELSFNRGRPSKVLQNKDAIVAFLEQPDISYCAPGRKDTAYCGKSNGTKIYRSKHYLLYSYHELVSLYNEENEEKVTYHQVREIITSEKHLIMQGKTPEDDCRCETCENAELFLQSIHHYFDKEKRKNLVSSLPTDPMELVEMGVCSVKLIQCMNGECAECPGKVVIAKICEELEKVDSLSYYRWVTRQKNVHKIQEQVTGEEAASLLSDLVDGNKMRMHKYNIYRQFSELKWLKKNLKEDEVILSVDFSKNYENKQRHEVQSAYFGHESFTIFTAACYFHKNISIKNGQLNAESNLVKFPVVVISNETSHDRNVAFSNNNQLIRMVKDLVPTITTFHFWSDGCAGQFRSQFVFRSFCYYPADINLTWSYGEAHHFKGPHDGIGGTVKRKVFREVVSGKIVIENAQQFAKAADQLCNITVMYLDAADIESPDLSDSIYTHGTLKIHHAKRLNLATVHLFLNSTFKQPSDIYKSLSWKKQSEVNNVEGGAKNTIGDDVERNEESDEKMVVEPVESPINPADLIAGDWVLVRYEEERFIGKVICIKNTEVQVRCLDKPYGIHEPQKFEREEDAIFYTSVFRANEQPKMVQRGRKWFWTY